MSLDLPAGAACFVDANIFVYHLVELGAVSAACGTFLERAGRSEFNAISTAACMADAVQRVMATSRRGSDSM